VARVRIAIVAALVFVLDWVSKHWVATHMAVGESRTVLPGFLDITYVRNAGAAFGLLQGQTVLFVIITAVVIVLIATYGRRAAQESPLLGYAFGLQLGGALGNLLDRLLYGRVIDFIAFRVWPYVFNFADASLVIGGALFALVILREPQAGTSGTGRP
jgi:signal peptidase II